MTNARAVKLIEKAVTFYIHQNLEVPANMWQFKLDTRCDGYAEECFKKREEFRAAMALVKEVLE